MKKLNKLLTLIIVICAFCCIPKQIANAKESYPQISMGKVYTGTITNKNVNDRYILKVAKTGSVLYRKCVELGKQIDRYFLVIWNLEFD